MPVSDAGPEYAWFFRAEFAGADAVFGLAWCPPAALTGGGPPIRGGGDPGDGRLSRAFCSARGSCG